jgi:S-adenosylmethionine decarboxylase proenzyme
MLLLLALFITMVLILMMRRKTDHVGVHYIIDVDDADDRLLYDNTAMIKVCDDALRKSGVTIVNKAVHAFHPHGLTLLYLLTESHFSLHTWPEHRKIRIDFFSCQNHEKCEIGCDHLKRAFHGSTIRVQRLYR